MFFERLSESFFAFRNVHCDEVSISDETLLHSDVLLPIVLLCIRYAIKNTALEGKVLDFKAYKQYESLCFIAVDSVNSFNDDVTIMIIDELGGFKAINELADPNSTRELDFKPLVMAFRNRLKPASEYTSLEESLVLDEIFSEYFTLTLSQDFLDKALTIINSNKSSKPTVRDSLGFEQYSLLGTTPPQLFEELAVITVASYLSENPLIEVHKIKAEELTKASIDLVLAAILCSPKSLQILSKHYQCQPSQVVMPENIYMLRQKLKNKAVTRSLSLDDASTSWYDIATRYVSKLEFDSDIQFCCVEGFSDGDFNESLFVEALLSISHNSIEQLKRLNISANHISKALKIEKQLSIELNNKVIGQQKAIDSLTKGYLTSNISQNTGPRLIFTFAGPSGVGKTYLSTIFCDLLNEYEGSGYTFTVLNMEQYSHKNDAMKLFGSGVQYSDANLGLITSAVRAQPRQVILFDEIEKAHSNVTQSLLSILDTGLAQDQTSQEFVNFDQCIIIFTTNLGQDVLANNKQQNQLNIFDVLRYSQSPSNGTKLSVEFVNRLSKGYSVLFTPLQINHFTYLAEKELSKVNEHQDMLDFHWPSNFGSFLLQSLAPDITARQLTTSLAKLKAEILVKSSDLIPDDLVSISCNVSVNESVAGIDATQVLIFDNDEQFQSKIEFLDHSLSTKLVDNAENIKQMMQQYRPDAFLIDMDSVSKAQLSIDEITEKVHGINPKLPIFSFRLVNKDVVEQKKQSLNHHIRQHFELEIETIETTFSDMLMRINYFLTTEKTLRRMMSRNERVEYQCRVELKDNTLDVSFSNLSYSQVIHSKDLQETSFFNHSLPSDSLDDVIGLDRAKKRLKEVISWLKTPDKLLNFGVKVPTGFLFAGPPGTGKTLLAKAVAGECELPFFSVTASELSSPNNGGTTENIKKLFTTARKYSPSIVFIDEIDAIAGQRTNNTDGSSRDRNLTVNALLTEMDGFSSSDTPIFVMAATNFPQLLDKAITRPGRFDETIYCDLPNKSARFTFFKRFADKHNLNWQETELQQLVSSAQGMSSAQIEQVLRESVYQAVGENEQLSAEHIIKTMIRVAYGSPSEHILLSDEAKLSTAYHEAAHLLAYKLLFPKQPVDFITIEPRNFALGFVATREAEKYESLSKRRVMNKLQVLLAGRVGEKICTGDSDEVSTGASSDIEKATELAMHAIYEGGIEPSIGPINVAILTKFEESDLLSNAQQAVKKWLDLAEVEVETLLNDNYDLLALIATKLLDKESLLGHEIEQIFTS
ncbi:AAA family ATPase [Shewanella ulleungensis]|uniref:AAA family ATPase n=1 Tax=Shewanella ulleungensis TaxID=2282699 RepID=UPI003D7A0408